MGDLGNVIGQNGVKIDVGIDTESVLYLAIGVFFGVVFGGVVIKLLTRNM